MIKVLGFRQFFNEIKAKFDVRREYFNGKLDVESIPYLYKNYKEILSKVPESQHFNLHYGIYNVYAGKGDIFKSTDIIPIDIDEADYSRVYDYVAIIEEVFNTTRDRFAIVKSGHGLHFILQQKTLIQTEEAFVQCRSAYAVLCKNIQARMTAATLAGKCDQAIWRKMGTLRFPGTMNQPLTQNHTYFTPVLSEVLANDIQPIDFDLSSLVYDKAPREAMLDAEFLRAMPTPDTEAVIEECNFIKWCFEAPQEVSEPEWYAALSVVSRFENGKEIAHNMSKGHPHYNFTETEGKIEQALASGGPRTCSNIETLSDKCAGCKHYKQITSPILIKGPNYIRSINTGFWNIAIQKDGSVKYTLPNYEDLRRYFVRKVGSYVSTASGHIHIWRDTHWERLDDIFLKAFIQDNLDPAPNNQQVQEFLSLVKRTNPVQDDWFNRSTERKLNLKNGILDLGKMELIAHSKTMGFTYVLPYDFDANATCPTFDQFMVDVTLARVDLNDLILEFIGYAFSGMEYVHHKVMLLSGDGANGKSTLLSLLGKLAGPKAYSTLLMTQLGLESYRAQLIGKLFNIAEETPRKSLEDASAFKILSAGGEMTARELYSNPINFKNKAKFIFACNELPTSSEFTEGFFRRFIIVPFDNTFRGSKADPYIEQKMSAELPGILNRVIEGYKRLMANGRFTDSMTAKKATEDFKMNSDTVAQWAEEEIHLDIDNCESEQHFIPMSDLYSVYLTWCDRNKIHPGLRSSKDKVGKYFNNLGFPSSIKKISGKPIRGRCGVNVYEPMDFDSRFSRSQ